MKKIVDNIARLIDLKSMLTAAMTFGLLMMVAKQWEPNETVMALFSSTYGMMVAFFFSKKSKTEKTENEEPYTGTLEDTADE